MPLAPRCVSREANGSPDAVAWTADREINQLYLTAKAMVVEAGFAEELAWQATRVFDEVTETDFLREYAWVVLNSGMRESIVRRRFPAVSAAFLWWDSGRAICANKDACVREASRVFNHRRKLDAIACTASGIADRGFACLRNEMRDRLLPTLRRLPFMGPATSLHLAKNLGCAVAKPDRHLERISAGLNYPDPQTLCEALAASSGDAVAVVDMVWWRFGTLFPNFIR